MGVIEGINAVVDWFIYHPYPWVPYVGVVLAILFLWVQIFFARWLIMRSTAWARKQQQLYEAEVYQKKHKLGYYAPKDKERKDSSVPEDNKKEHPVHKKSKGKSER